WGEPFGFARRAWKARPTVPLVLALLTASAAVHAAPRTYEVRGMVIAVDVARRTFVVSHEAIDGFMPAMAMPFEVADAAELAQVVPGALVTFTLRVDDRAGYASHIRLRRYETVQQDPLAARRLALLNQAVGRQRHVLSVGEAVPDFALIDQARQSVRLSALAGRVVVVNFIYTRCAIPQFCPRMTNDFSVLQRRFQGRLGTDLVLLSVTFDPVRDQPDVLARYAAQWRADGRSWHFLTGVPADVRRVCDLFGVDAFFDEGLMTHSLRTAVIDRRGRVAASIEGNEFTPEQLGDLVGRVLGQ
ncbi:MAG TPA: SCO family protein, partial [Vicinamibacterales bacterium]|nr:SCO family protein [Vicinamibacterales bacterium]